MKIGRYTLWQKESVRLQLLPTGHHTPEVSPQSSQTSPQIPFLLFQRSFQQLGEEFFVAIRQRLLYRLQRIYGRQPFMVVLAAGQVPQRGDVEESSEVTGKSLKSSRRKVLNNPLILLKSLQRLHRSPCSVF